VRYYLVDLIREWEADKRITGVKNVSMTEDFLEYHFPKYPTMPGVLLLESMAQLAGWLEAVSSGFRRWVLIERVHQCKFYRFARPGDQVEITIETVRADGSGLKVYQGVGSVGGQRRIVAEFEGKVVPLDELEHPEEQSALFQILARGTSGSLSAEGAAFGS